MIGADSSSAVSRSSNDTADNVLWLLRFLTKVNKHVTEELKDASLDAESIEAKYAFCKFARESRSRVHELQMVRRGLGEDPDNSASWFYCHWIRLRNRLDRPDDYGRACHCLTHLEGSIDAYLDTLENRLPDVVKRILERQLRETCAAYNALATIPCVTARVPLRWTTLNYAHVARGPAGNRSNPKLRRTYSSNAQTS